MELSVNRRSRLPIKDILKRYQESAKLDIRGPGRQRKSSPSTGGLRKLLTGRDLSISGQVRVNSVDKRRESSPTVKNSKFLSEEELSHLPPKRRYTLSHQTKSSLKYGRSMIASIPSALPVGILPFSPFMFGFGREVDPQASENQTTSSFRGHRIPCFTVGGEERLVLPHVLNELDFLAHLSTEEVDDLCQKLHIRLIQCDELQLHKLRESEVLPKNATQAAVIRRSDAERLCNAVLDSEVETAVDLPTRNTFKVYHKCFGKNVGIAFPVLYSAPEAKCVNCCTCRGMFSPASFVGHAHTNLENNVCHWGFDSSKWRSYLQLAKGQPDESLLQKSMTELKDKFKAKISGRKRKEVCEDEVALKSARVEVTETPSGSSSSAHTSAFKPWPSKDKSPLSYLQKPPVLLHPERVVPDSSKSSGEKRHYAPNISLHPESAPPKAEESDDESYEAVSPPTLIKEEREEGGGGSRGSSALTSPCLPQPPPAHVHHHDNVGPRTSVAAAGHVKEESEEYARLRRICRNYEGQLIDMTRQNESLKAQHAEELQKRDEQCRLYYMVMTQRGQGLMAYGRYIGYLQNLLTGHGISYEKLDLAPYPFAAAFLGAAASSTPQIGAAGMFPCLVPGLNLPVFPKHEDPGK